MKLKIKLVHPDAKLPKRANPTDSGLDLCSVETVDVYPWTQAIVDTGLQIELPPDTEAQIRPRSGLAAKHKITVTNSPGTIDEGYQGNLKVILFNLGRDKFTVEKGDRIAQMVIAPVLRPEIELVTELSDSERGENGFGSTGVK